MRIVKEASGGQGVAVTPEELAQINRLSRRELTAEQVYTFAVRLCDNQVDRDGERFSAKTIEELAGLFVGKSGIFDHDWSAKGQAARIYRTQVVRDEGVLTDAGDPCVWLKGYAYMLRTGDSAALIDEIEGGIKKEVSVGCAVERSVCSICGADWNGGACGHKKGEVYDGKLCFVSLEGASDAYEFSFVAVPAQPLAGVVKGAMPAAGTLAELVKGRPRCAGELARLEREAALGRAHLEQLRGETIRMGRLADKGLTRELLGAMVKGLDGEQLAALKAAFAARAAGRYPLKTQFSYAGADGAKPDPGDGAFLI